MQLYVSREYNVARLPKRGGPRQEAPRTLAVFSALGLLAAAALAGRQWAARTVQLFEFKDYDHAHPSKR